MVLWPVSDFGDGRKALTAEGTGGTEEPFLEVFSYELWEFIHGELVVAGFGDDDFRIAAAGWVRSGSFEEHDGKRVTSDVQWFAAMNFEAAKLGGGKVIAESVFVRALTGSVGEKKQT